MITLLARQPINISQKKRAVKGLPKGKQSDDEHDSLLESDGESLKYDEDGTGDEFDVEEYKGAEEKDEDEDDSDVPVSPNLISSAHPFSSTWWSS
jgi:hypothetical protein